MTATGDPSTSPRHEQHAPSLRALLPTNSNTRRLSDTSHLWLCRRFFKYILPRLKYRNPAVPITVDRKAAQTDPAVMTIIFGEAGTNATTSTSNAAATSAPSGASSNDRVVTIQMKHKSESEILQQLYDATGAQELEPTELEREELRELEERKERSKKDSERMIEVNRQRKREAQMLAAARGEIGVNPA